MGVLARGYKLHAESLKKGEGNACQAGLPPGKLVINVVRIAHENSCEKHRPLKWESVSGTCLDLLKTGAPEVDVFF